ncbi:MAG: 4-alpha-glucanotransferase [Acidobacteria bacterium]|nr:MAG: 4-alpha-glucanotransferase [Acidobacteriota bacterium]
MRRRASGILLHITSLPSDYGIGDLGPDAYRFVEFLAQAKQSFWQVLPLNPTNPAMGNSPYNGLSAFAGNWLLISPERMVRDGWLAQTDLDLPSAVSEERVRYDEVIAWKGRLFDRAYERFKRDRLGRAHDYETFRAENAHWLEDYALFMALRARFAGSPWSEWPRELRDRQPEALHAARRELAESIEREIFLQYLFFQQWRELAAYGRERGIQMIGDMPFYVNYDSADVWAHPEIFKLDEEKKPLVVSGVPPDYFSATGQLWGNPIYRWDVLKETGYRWWMERMAHTLKLFDVVRIDHFRGFAAYWEVPADASTALNGRWVEGPGDDFFAALLRRFPYLPIIAEDLGLITPDVRELMHRFDLPGMRLLLFAFGEERPEHPYLPHNYVRHCVVYTGTHDNNTVRGWFETEATPEDRRRLFRYLGREVSADDVHWAFVRLAMMSVANLVIIPLQDVLGLGAEARMNRPATTEGNWRWRLRREQLAPSVAQMLREMTEIYGRA